MFNLSLVGNINQDLWFSKNNNKNMVNDNPTSSMGETLCLTSKSLQM